jgi:hypothetical protein
MARANLFTSARPRHRRVVRRHAGERRRAEQSAGAARDPKLVGAVAYEGGGGGDLPVHYSAVRRYFTSHKDALTFRNHVPGTDHPTLC